MVRKVVRQVVHETITFMSLCLYEAFMYVSLVYILQLGHTQRIIGL